MISGASPEVAYLLPQYNTMPDCSLIFLSSASRSASDRAQIRLISAAACFWMRAFSAARRWVAVSHAARATSANASAALLV
jgi:hypothetical protein